MAMTTTRWCHRRSAVFKAGPWRWALEARAREAEATAARQTERARYGCLHIARHVK